MQARTARKQEVGDGGQLPLLIAPTPRRKRQAKRGRPRKARAGTPHKRRPSLSTHHPVHVVLRVVKEIGSLRRRLAYHAIRNATITVADRRDFQIVHLSLQRTHIHLLVEADDRRALSRGMQSFQIAAAKQLNRLLTKGGPRRRGRVFSDRYYAEIITSPRQAHHALSYVLNNWRKHAEDRDPRMHGWTFDWFSSGWTFPAWAERSDEHFAPKPPPTYEALIVRRPSTWLLCEGYKKHGAISFHAVPSAHHR